MSEDATLLRSGMVRGVVIGAICCSRSVVRVVSVEVAVTGTAGYHVLPPLSEYSARISRTGAPSES